MHKVVVNNCYGGFGLSEKAIAMLQKLKGTKELNIDRIPRHDPDLVKVVETLGSDGASADYADLTIDEIPGNRYLIQEYDGSEWVTYPEDPISWIVIK